MRAIISPKESLIRLAEMYPFELTNENLACIFNNGVSAIHYDPDDEYKTSVFNYVCVGSKCVSIYNTLYSSLAVLSYNEYEAVSNMTECPSELANDMVENGFWVKKQTDERQFFVDCAAYLNDLCSGHTITLAVTHNCNARCSYCYEHGIGVSSMTDEVIDGVVDFISTRSKNVRINWFGGEPLMNTEAIDKISSKLNERGIDFSSYLITNGSLINNDIIDKMKDLWNVKDVQISIDGQEETYLREKNYQCSDDDIYYKILDNIIKIAKAGIFVHIRINISHNNKSEIFALQKELENVFSQYDNIIIYPAFVTGTGNPFTENEIIDIVSEMMRNTRDVSKLTADTKLFSLPRLHSCAVQSKNSFTIDADGYVYKCEHHVGEKNSSVGSIDSVNSIRNVITNSIPARCGNCVFLPKCMGGCKENELSGDIPCFIEKYIIIGYMNCIS